MCNDFKVSLHHGEVCIHMKSAEIASDSVCCAEQDAKLIQELWYLQDITLWAVDLDNPPLKVAMNGPDREK
jgi:hypothetical protein